MYKYNFVADFATSTVCGFCVKCVIGIDSVIVDSDRNIYGFVQCKREIVAIDATRRNIYECDMSENHIDVILTSSLPVSLEC